MSTTLSVPSGNNGATVSLNFATSANASAAQTILSPLYNAATAGTLDIYPSASIAGGVNEFVIAASATGVLALPPGYDDVIDAATGSVTLSGTDSAANQLVVASNGGFDLYESGASASGTIFAGGGANTIVLTQSSGGFTVGGDGQNTVYLTVGTIATDAIAVMAGNANIAVAGDYADVYGSGANTTDVIALSGTNDTDVVYAGASTVFAATGGVFYDTTGTLEFINAGTATLVQSATSGAVTAFGGSGNSAYFQSDSSAAFTFVNGASNSSIISGSAGGMVGFDGDGGQINLFGASAGAYNYLIGGDGAETLNAAFSGGPVEMVAGAANAAIFASNSTPNAIFGGGGASTVVSGTTTSNGLTTALADEFAFVNGQAGGSMEILQWGAAGTLVFLGYGSAGNQAIQAAIAAAPTNGSTSSIILPDNTQVTLVGLNGQPVTWNTPFFG